MSAALFLLVQPVITAARASGSAPEMKYGKYQLLTSVCAGVRRSRSIKPQRPLLSFRSHVFFASFAVSSRVFICSDWSWFQSVETRQQR